MRALRIIITQSKAHYRKEETVDNKMTYPLPPFSTVIGAIHRACNFREYHPMDLSVQGTYSSLIKQPYIDHCFYDSVNQDRGMLVKMKNPNLLNSEFDKIAKSLKDNSNFVKKKDILILNEKLLDEYIILKNLDEKITEFKKERIDKIFTLIKLRKKNLSQKKKKSEKKSIEYLLFEKRENQIKNLEKKIEEEFKNFKKVNFSDKIVIYQNMITSLKYYEVLHEVKILIHITSEEEGLLETIQDNIYNLKALGRSEDFVNVEDCEIVNLKNIEEDEEIDAVIPSYINTKYIKSGDIQLDKTKKGMPMNGTKYYLGKVYNKEKGFRDFGDKVKVLYTSKYMADEDSENIYVDEIEKGKLKNLEKFLVQFS